MKMLTKIERYRVRRSLELSLIRKWSPSLKLRLDHRSHRIRSVYIQQVCIRLENGWVYMSKGNCRRLTRLSSRASPWRCSKSSRTWATFSRSLFSILPNFLHIGVIALPQASAMHCHATSVFWGRCTRRALRSTSLYIYITVQKAMQTRSVSAPMSSAHPRPGYLTLYGGRANEQVL